MTKASEFGKPEWNNGPLMVELLSLRQEHARLLGYASFAEVSLVPKMADQPSEVLDFLRDLGRRARPYAERDVREVREFAAAELGIADLQPWDFTYASEKLREARYAYSEQELKKYFTEPRVLAGLFKVIETLFSVAIREDSAPVWHPDVKFFRIENLKGRTRSGSSTSTCTHATTSRAARGRTTRGRGAARRPGLPTPVSYLTCNFSRPVGGKPATFQHDDVLTLFHEFGHGLHHMLTRVDEPSVSGIHGVEWDAVELPSQFMENFAWEWEVLQLLTEHVDTGEKLPRALFDKMIAARNFQSGFYTMRQIEFSLFDMRLHGGPPPATEREVMAQLDEIRREVTVLQAARIQPLSARFLAHLRGRLRGRLLQLQVGRSAVGRRLFGIRGRRRAEPGDRSPLPRRNPRRRRQPPGDAVVRRLPRAEADDRRLAAPPRHGELSVGGALRSRGRRPAPQPRRAAHAARVAVRVRREARGDVIGEDVLAARAAARSRTGDPRSTRRRRARSRPDRAG